MSIHKRSKTARDLETGDSVKKIFLSYSHDPISLLPIIPDQDDHLRKFRVDYEKARVSILAQALTDAQFYVTVDLVDSPLKTGTWAEEQLRDCDYFIIVISEAYFQYICQQHSCDKLQISLPKLRTLESFVNDVPSRTIVVSFISEPNNIIPPVLADVNILHLLDMPKLQQQKNFEQLIHKLRPGYDDETKECGAENGLSDTFTPPNTTDVEDNASIDSCKDSDLGEVSEDKLGEMKPAPKKPPKDVQLKLTRAKHVSEIIPYRTRRSLNVPTPLLTLGVQQTRELTIAGKKVIDLSYSSAKELPVDLPYHFELEVLWLSNNLFDNLDYVILSKLSHLEELYLHNNNIKVYPSQLCNCFSSLRILWLSSNGLVDLPEKIGDLVSLEHLHLSENGFTCIPNGIFKLSNLKVLYLNHNRISQVPDEIAELKSLERLYLNDNVIDSVSNCILKLSKLKKVMLLENSFYVLPDFVRGSSLKFRIEISSVNNPTRLSKVSHAYSNP